MGAVETEYHIPAPHMCANLKPRGNDDRTSVMSINLVGPDGAITFRDAPFALCGNRGAIDDGEKVTTQYKGNDWIYCLTGALRNPDEFMNGRTVTDLFFLDEATALSAGHRPCHQCNWQRAKDFESAWVAAKLGNADVDSIDHRLKEDRLTLERTKKTFTSAFEDLPIGTMIRLNGEPFLVASDVVYPWNALGYGIPRDVPLGEVEVLTPESTTLVMQQPTFVVSNEKLIMRWEATS